MRKLLQGLAAAALAAAVAVPALAETRVITWGLLAVESQDNLMKRWAPVLKVLSERTGYEIKPFFATDYTGVIEAMRFGKVDVTHAGNKSAMTFVDRANAEIFVQETEADGSAGYYTILVTQADNDKINSLEDVLATCKDKSLDFGFGDPQSTSGFLVPTTFIFAANKITPRACFKTVLNASHEANLLAAANRQVNVATAHNIALHERLKKNNPAAFAKLKEIWRSPVIASDPLLWRVDLEDEVKAKLYHAILGMGRTGTPEQIKKDREMLANGGWGLYNPSSNLQLLPFREMEANKAVLQTQGDTTLTAADKAKRVAELEAEIVRIRELAAALPNR